MKNFGFIFCCILISSMSFAQVAPPNQVSTKIEQSIMGLGVSAGVASGFGLSFRHHLPGDFSYQLVGGVVKVDRDVLYNIGAEGQYDFIRSEMMRFYGAGALGYFYEGKSGNNDLKGPLRFGLGIGTELSRGVPLHVNLELLFTFFSNGDIIPLPQVGAHYYFF